MPPSTKELSKSVYIISIIVIILGVLFAYLAFRGDKTIPPQVTEEASRESLFSQEVSNPLEGSSNPYENIKTNPFE